MSSIPEEFKVSFQLTKHDDDLGVRAWAKGGEAKAETRAPSQALLDHIAEHDPARIPSSVVESVGRELYDSLIVGDAAKLARDVLKEGTSKEIPVQFEVRFDPNQVSLAQFPWEMITNDLGQALVRDGRVDLTRYITYPQPPPEFDAKLNELPLLRVVSSPSQLPPIFVADLTLERLETITHATFELLMKKLLIERLESWGLQFDGHGALVVKCPKCDTLNTLKNSECCQCKAQLEGAKHVSALAFERNGGVDWVTTEEIGSILYNSKVRLALLLACESSRVGNKFIFSGLSAGLLLAGVPAVVGMQYPVLDDFANNFAHSFYQILLESNDVLKALRTARRMSLRGAWYSPTLYLRHQRSFEVDQPSKPTFQTRSIDTAVPSEVQAGVDFLTRLWIRRPETKPFEEAQLREELDVPEHIPISTRQAEAEIKLDVTEERKFRRGEVDVHLRASGCEVTPETIKLFIDEHLDAPHAIFTVRATRTGRIPLIFSVEQDGGQIVAVTHHITSVDAQDIATTEGEVATQSTHIPFITQEKVALHSETRPELDQVMETMLQLSGAERGYLMLRNRETGELDFYGGHNIDLKSMTQGDLDLSQEIVGRVVHSGEPVLTTNAQEDARFQGVESLRSYSLRSILCIPLKVKGVVIGVMYMDNRIQAGLFAESSRDQLVAYANQALVIQPQDPIFELLPPLFEWCEIPAGRVSLRGIDDAFDVQPFLMAKYLVTYEQFQVFIDAADGFHNDEWWQVLAANIEHRKAPGSQSFTHARNLPRENVSWYDAVAFCRWLSNRVGYEVRLPTEWEWQWAAQGPDGRAFPWGNNFDQSRCNTEENGIGNITPVDSYPEGASPYGVLDMSGNVWEWCLNEYREPANVNTGGNNLRVLRGGSWYFNQDYARASARFGLNPFFCDSSVGFRVCCGGPPSHERP